MGQEDLTSDDIDCDRGMQCHLCPICAYDKRHVASKNAEEPVSLLFWTCQTVCGGAPVQKCSNLFLVCIVVLRAKAHVVEIYLLSAEDIVDGLG